jgi:hypothetical protein
MADRYWVAGGTGNYNSTTNWSATSGGASGASVPTTVDNVFFNAASGTGIATITSSANCRDLNLTGFSGTLNFTNPLTLNGTILNFGLGTYTVTGAQRLRLITTLTITSNGTNYTGNIDIGSTITVTLADNLTCSGTFECSSGTTSTMNGNTLNISGNLLFSGTLNLTGTTSIVFNGTGTWSHTSTGVLRNNVTINTAGTLTLGTNVYYNTGTLTYTAGTVITTGNTLLIGAATTLNTNGITWNNISAITATNITLGSNLTLTGTLINGAGGATTLSFTLGGNSLISTNANLTLTGNSTFTMPANQTFKTLTSTGTGGNINTNTLTITENLTIGTSAPISGTTSIVYGGTGTWTALNSSSFINNNLTINTAGTLTISGIVYKGSGLFTYIAGTIDDTTGTVAVQGLTLNISGFTFRKVLVNGTITLTSNINATTFGTWSSSPTSFTLAGNTINFTHLELGNTGTTTLPTVWVCQDIEFKNVSSGILNTNSITINGNILQSGTGVYTSGTTSFIYAGTGTWTATAVGYFLNSFTINTAGTLTFISANIGGGIFTYTAGTVTTTGSILYIRTPGTTMNHGIIVWNDVILGNSAGSGNITSLILNNKLTCLGTLTFGISNTTFSGTDGTFDTYNLVFGTEGTASRTTALVSTKTYRVRQSLTCTQATNTFRISLRSTIATSQAIFTVDPGATMNVGFVDPTDIDSSLGRPIYSYRGVFSNTLNWNLLPTDVTPKVNTFSN